MFEAIHSFGSDVHSVYISIYPKGQRRRERRPAAPSYNWWVWPKHRTVLLRSFLATDPISLFSMFMRQGILHCGDSDWYIAGDTIQSLVHIVPPSHSAVVLPSFRLAGWGHSLLLGTRPAV